MSNPQITRARELAREHRYQQAIKLIQHIDHPGAREWMRQFRRKQRRLWHTRLVHGSTCVILLILFALSVVGALALVDVPVAGICAP